MKISNELFFGAVMAACVVSGTAMTLVAQSKPNAPPNTTSQPTEAERGERAFNANCSRCHYAPDTLNPRITGTVIRHMRVRANLSAADERAILHYLNP